MKMEIRPQNKREMMVVRIISIVMMVLLVAFINSGIMKSILKHDPTGAVPFYALTAVFAGLIALSVFLGRRPRILLEGETVTFYPLFKRSRTMKLTEITSRKADADYSDPGRAGAMAAMGGGLIPYTVMRRNTSALRPVTLMKYSYFSGTQKLITITSKMDHAKKFDTLVKSMLSEQKTL